MLVTVLVGEADHGVVPPISACDDGACRPQIDAQIDVRCRLGVDPLLGEGAAANAVQALRGVRCHAVTLS